MIKHKLINKVYIDFSLAMSGYLNLFGLLRLQFSRLISPTIKPQDIDGNVSFLNLMMSSHGKGRILFS